MTVCQKGTHEGVLRQTVIEEGLDSDEPNISFLEKIGRINSDLTVGVDMTSASKLLANEGICHDGVKLHGRGFIVRPAEALYLGLGQRAGAENVIRHYLNGRDLNQHSRGVMVIDLFGLEAEEVRRQFPEIYQHLLVAVKPIRDQNRRPSRRSNWWLFGENQPAMRAAVAELGRFIATADTARHRIFQFLDENVVCDDKVVICASADGFVLGVLSARFHVVWANKAGVRLGVGNDPVYASNRCFDPFPFPSADHVQKHRIRLAAEDLDSHRKCVIAEHPYLTLTSIYNVLERVRGGVALDAVEPDERRIFEDGLVLILKELHENLDALVADAYGWPVNLTDEDILARLSRSQQGTRPGRGARTGVLATARVSSAALRHRQGEGRTRPRRGWHDSRKPAYDRTETIVSDRRCRANCCGHVCARGGFRPHGRCSGRFDLQTGSSRRI
jgi:hypothetical protein